MAPLFRREPSSRRAEKLVSRGKIEAAIKEYRRLLEADPEDSGTLNRVGDLYARVNKYGEAIDLYRQTAERFVEEGFYVKAIAVYKKIHRLDSNQLDVYEKLAGLYSVQGLVKDARTQYEVLVDYYEKDGQLSSAISNCKKIVELEPKDPAHRTRLAELYERQGDLSKVVNEYLQIARVMLDHGLIEKATQVLERAVEIHPLDVDFLVGAFDLMRRRGQEEFAEEFLADAESRIRQAEKNELFDEVLARIRELPGPVAPPPEETATAPPEPARDEEPEAAVEDEPAVVGMAEEEDGTLVLEPPDEGETDVVVTLDEVAAGSAEAEEAPADPSDLLAEVEVFIKYGFREKALDRLGEVLREFPDSVIAYRQLVELLLEDRAYRAAMEAANKMAAAVDRTGTSDGWEQLRQRLVDEGFLVEGDEVKATPADVTEEASEEIDLLEPQGADLHSIIESARESSSASGHGRVESEPAAAAPSAPPVADGDEDVEFVVVDEDFEDLAEEVSREMAAGAPVETAETPSLEEIVESFKEGVAEHLSSEDYDTHYNLGIAYREMGLLDEAIGEFQISAASPDYFIGSCSLMGLCFRDKGELEEAKGWYEKGLGAKALSPEEKMSLLYDLADTLESTGERESAASTFAEVQKIDDGYRDVADRLAALQ